MRPKSKKPAKKMGRPSTGFDKREYQRLYMRDKTQADKVGLTVAQWRARKGMG